MFFPKWLVRSFGLSTPGLFTSTKSFKKSPNTDWRRRQSGIYRVQCIGVGYRHSPWLGRRAGRPRQEPGQVSGGILSKSHVRWSGESRQKHRLNPGASGLDPQWPGFSIAFQGTSVFGSRQTATAGLDVVQSGRPIFDDFFQHLWPYIGNNTANVVFQMVKRLWLRPMTLHSPTENSLAVLNHKILDANSQVQNVKLGGH
ncbi:uncharacterized protein TNCV_2823381 [Trichonephila clavipes]|nr:uncharacterized protein TNCV_2823381 [Trichonephila clavipes]